MRYIYSCCYSCGFFRQYEVDEDTYFEFKAMGLLIGDSKISTICNECLEIMKEANGYEQGD